MLYITFFYNMIIFDLDKEFVFNCFVEKKVSHYITLIKMLLQLIFATLLSSAFSSSEQLDGRIIGGIPAAIEEFPYQISLRLRGNHFCGGSIIHYRHILTAAHCIYQFDISAMTVRVGSASAREGGADFKICKVFINKLYNPEDQDNDIAMIKLCDLLPFSRTVLPIALPLQDESVPTGTNAVVTGWGYTKENGHLSPNLLKIEVPIISYLTCKTLYGPQMLVTSNMVCAGLISGGMDACQGDSGGPLRANGKLIGIVSWGAGCGRPRLPGVYTKVSKYRGWIDAVIKLVAGKPHNVNPRIIGGSDADIKDYPHQVSIMFKGNHGCGGSIITNRHILTAAHCTYESHESEITVRIGSSFRTSGGEIYGVSKVHFHDQFNIDTYDYDISVLELDDEIIFGDSAKPIELIEASYEVPDNNAATATGWGVTSNNGQLADRLQKVLIPTISTATCIQYYGTGDDGLSERMFCAGEEGHDACQGDSGGPLISDNILVGIVSWGDICGLKDKPGVYTKISKFRDYIDGIINM